MIHSTSFSSQEVQLFYNYRIWAFLVKNMQSFLEIINNIIKNKEVIEMSHKVQGAVDCATTTCTL